jgi:hypothetical protein
VINYIYFNFLTHGCLSILVQLSMLEFKEHILYNTKHRVHSHWTRHDAFSVNGRYTFCITIPFKFFLCDAWRAVTRRDTFSLNVPLRFSHTIMPLSTANLKSLMVVWSSTTVFRSLIFYCRKDWSLNVSGDRGCSGRQRS